MTSLFDVNEQSLAKGETAETFAHEMAEKANQYGLNTYVSEMTSLFDVNEHKPTEAAALQWQLERRRADRRKWEDLLAQQCRALKLPHSVPHYAFAIDLGRNFEFDRAWISDRLGCEIDGAIWSGGRHATGSGITRDCEKFTLAAILGWRLVRVTGDQVKSGAAVKWIEQALMWRAP